MSKTYTEGQEIAFSLNDGTFQEQGFLDGTTVKIVEARFGKEAEIAPEYKDPSKAYASRIVAKLTFNILKKDGTEKTFKPQEYSTGIQWDTEKSTATVTPDGKRLVAKKGFNGFQKMTDFYHLLESAVSAGFPEDGFKGDISVFDGLTFQLVSEANPRATVREGKEPRKKPFFALLIGSNNSNTTSTSSAPANGKNEPAVQIDSSVLEASIQALNTLIAESPTNSISRRDIAAKVSAVADRNKWELQTRIGVMNALFEPAKLSHIANVAGFKLNGDTVSA